MSFQKVIWKYGNYFSFDPEIPHKGICHTKKKQQEQNVYQIYFLLSKSKNIICEE
jgi:hypothetical protein